MAFRKSVPLSTHLVKVAASVRHPGLIHFDDLVGDDVVTFLAHKIHLLTQTGGQVNRLGPPLVAARDPVGVVHPQRSRDDSGVVYFTFELIRPLRTITGFAVDVITPFFTHLSGHGLPFFVTVFVPLPLGQIQLT